MGVFTIITFASIFFIIFLASVGKSLGVRKLYVEILVRIFEYGRANIDAAKKTTRRPTANVDDEEEDDNDSESKTSIANGVANDGSTKLNGHLKANGNIPNGGNSVISREKILLPEADSNNKNNNKESGSDNETAVKDDEDEKFEFNLSNCLDYVKAGMEAIIEDEVTSRFEAEELKNWNLLTRTNRHYEFISWRLTVIWVFGFLLRYLILMPLRVLICFVGVSWMVVSMALIGLIRDRRLRFKLYEKAAKIAHIIILGSVTAHITYHNTRYRPKGSGFCVSNHTSPMDMSVLSADCILTLVAWCVVSMFPIGLIPHLRLRHFLSDKASKVTHRLISRSLSALIEFHNVEYRPKNGGFTVANHTSPIDISILSTDKTYSLVLYLTACTALVGSVPDFPNKRRLVELVYLHCFNLLSSALSSVIVYHNPENAPKAGGICVANHTSPIDVLILMCNNCYSLIGQRHGGFLGVLQRALVRASPHIWFERAEAKDRLAVAKRLKEHISDPDNPPILIFPEGTCINNTSVMQFKKGSFEVGGVIYPVAIKYDPKFGDAFWNSSRYSMMQYLYLMMTSWAIVCDVWYLPPMYRGENESAIDFANRVKGVIAKQGGLVDLMWDGQLKRMKPKKEWKEKQQEDFSKLLKGE